MPIFSGLDPVIHVTAMSHIHAFCYVYVHLLTYFTSVQQTPIIAHGHDAQAQPSDQPAVLLPPRPPTLVLRPALGPLQPSLQALLVHKLVYNTLYMRNEGFQQGCQSARPHRHQRRQTPSCWCRARWWQPLARPPGSGACRTRCWFTVSRCRGSINHTSEQALHGGSSEAKRAGKEARGCMLRAPATSSWALVATGRGSPVSAGRNFPSDWPPSAAAASEKAFMAAHLQTPGANALCSRASRRDYQSAVGIDG